MTSIGFPAGVSATVAAAAMSPLEQNKLRRLLQADMQAISDEISRFNPTPCDALTRQIANWKERFLIELRREKDENAVLRKYIGELKSFLIAYGPLDEKSVLGSDGHTYGYKSLILYLNRVPPEFKKRSPREPNNPAPFTFKPHSVVHYLINIWLKKHGESLSSPEIDKAYDSIPQAKRTELEEQAEDLNDPEKAKNREMLRNHLRINQRRVQQVRREDERFNRFLKELSDIGSREERALDASIQQAREDKRQYDARISAIRTQIQTIETEIDQLGAELKVLKDKANNVKEQIDEAEKEDRRLRELIIEMKIELKKRDKEWLKDAAIAIGTIAVCAAIAYFGPPLLLANGIELSAFANLPLAGLAIRY